jgi:hypothetical protein
MAKATREEIENGQHWCDRSDSWPEYDAQGIYLCRVCPECSETKLARYRPEILTGYGQSDVDEPIEPEEGVLNGL